MKLNKAQYEELFELFAELLDLLIESKSYVSNLAAYTKNHFVKPNFKNDFWTQFSKNYRLLIQSAEKYTKLDGELEEYQVKVKRIVPILRVMEPMNFLVEYRQYYDKINGDTLAKEKMKVAIDEAVLKLNPLYRYVEGVVSGQDSDFSLVSVDGKRKISVLVYLDKKLNIQVEASATYDDKDFKFEIPRIKFDMLQFQTIKNCIDNIISKITLKESMRVNGTRIKIGGSVVILSARELSLARADLIVSGTCKIYTTDGALLELSYQPIGKVVDRVAVQLITNGKSDKLYYTIDYNAGIKDEKVEPEIVIPDVLEDEPLKPEPIQPKPVGQKYDSEPVNSTEKLDSEKIVKTDEEEKPSKIAEPGEINPETTIKIADGKPVVEEPVETKPKEAPEQKAEESVETKPKEAPEQKEQESVETKPKQEAPEQKEEEGDAEDFMSDEAMENLTDEELDAIENMSEEEFNAMMEMEKKLSKKK